MDWSWGVLVFDFENDGKKDFFVSNGIQWDLMDFDFRVFMDNNNIYGRIENKEEIGFFFVIS